MSLPSFTLRAVSESFWTKVDKDWIKHTLLDDDCYIPAKHVPDQDQENRCYLLEADENWNDRRPANFCLNHQNHWH